MENEKVESTYRSLASWYVNYDREKYAIYKKSKEAGALYPPTLSNRILEVMDNLGYDMERPGTYLLGELVSMAFDYLKDADYEKELEIYRDLKSNRSNIVFVTANEFLEVRVGGFKDHILDAVNNIDKEKEDKELANKVYGQNGRSENAGIVAFKLAQYINDETKPNMKKCPVLAKKLEE